MRRIRQLAMALTIVTGFMLVTSATPQDAHAASCNYSIGSGQTVLVDFGCRIVGDVVVDGQQQYDNDSSSGLIVNCVKQTGCLVNTPFGGAYVSYKSVEDLEVELMADGSGNCGNWYGCSWVQKVNWYGTYTPPPVYPTTTWFNTGATVSGEIHYSNGGLYCWSCTLYNVTFSGYVVNGSVSPPPYPGTVNGRPRVGMQSGVVRFNPGDTVVGDLIALDPSPGGTGQFCYDLPSFRCYISNAPTGGLAHGIINPYSWEIPNNPIYVH